VAVIPSGGSPYLEAHPRRPISGKSRNSRATKKIPEAPSDCLVESKLGLLASAISPSVQRCFEKGTWVSWR
jgi:hypothetical protein